MWDFLIVFGIPWIIIGVANYVWLLIRPYAKCSIEELNMPWYYEIIAAAIIIILGPTINLIWLKLKYDKWMFS